MKQIFVKIIGVWQQKINPKLIPLLSIFWLIGFLISALALWGFLELADEVLEKETAILDLAVLKILISSRNSLLNNLAIGITYLGSPMVLSFFSLAIAIFLWWRQKQLQATFLAIVTSGGISLNYLLKNFFSRARPTLENNLVTVDFYSFPSGHAMTSLIIYGFLCYLLISNYRKYSLLLISFTSILIILIGLTRLYLGVHWLTDVIGGYVAGTVWLFLCISSLEAAKTYRLNKTYIEPK
ncbi:MAG: phosphatase PAP2 family protein [Stanieria sp.]